jgi:hypothetical protein
MRISRFDPLQRAKLLSEFDGISARSRDSLTGYSQSMKPRVCSAWVYVEKAGADDDVDDGAVRALRFRARLTDKGRFPWRRLEAR